MAKLARFALVGISSSAVYAAVVLLSTRYLSFDARIASAIGYLIALPFNFVLNREYTFLSTGRISNEAVRFAILHATNMFISVGLMHVTTVIAGWSVFVGIIVVVLAIPLIQFLLLERWVFQGLRKSRSAR